MTVRNNFGIHLMHTIQLFFKLPADPAMADTPNIAYTIFIFISSQQNNNNNESIYCRAPILAASLTPHRAATNIFYIISSSIKWYNANRIEVIHRIYMIFSHRSYLTIINP